MKEYKYKINGNSYKVTIGDIEDNIAHVEVNGTHYKVEMEKQPKPAAKPVTVRPMPNAPAAPTQVVKPAAPASGKSGVKSPLPGVILDIKVNVGDAVKKGQTIGVIGGTGSGKSSLVNLIPRFYDVTKGEIYIDGVNVKDYRIEALREKVGIVLQKAQLFKGTIRDNIRWGKKDATDTEIMEALDIAQAREFVEKKDGKLDSFVDQGGKNLSGGQRQRLTIARAVVRKPDILILDDSASALDYATDAALRKSIREMKDAPTLFIVSQRAASLMHADRIIVLDDGNVAGIGTHEELLENCEVYQEIYYSQFQKEKEA